MIVFGLFLFFLTLDIILEVIARAQQKPIQKQEQKVEVVQNSPLQQEMDELKLKLKQMYEDSEKFNNSDNFAKYSKIQRQMIPIQQKIQQLEQQLETEKQQIQQTQQETQPQKKQETPKQLNKLELIQTVILIVTVVYLRGSYFVVQGIQYDQLYPINLLIAKEENGQLWISLSYWCVQTFNTIRVIKKAFGLSYL
ncbi:hypothetical protein pb186bvf_014981 [Paramecium bursaria]